jgi:hypothetical protein
VLLGDWCLHHSLHPKGTVEVNKLPIATKQRTDLECACVCSAGTGGVLWPALCGLQVSDTAATGAAKNGIPQIIAHSRCKSAWRCPCWTEMRQLRQLSSILLVLWLQAVQRPGAHTIGAWPDARHATETCFCCILWLQAAWLGGTPPSIRCCDFCSVDRGGDKLSQDPGRPFAARFQPEASPAVIVVPQGACCTYPVQISGPPLTTIQLIMNAAGRMWCSPLVREQWMVVLAAAGAGLMATFSGTKRTQWVVMQNALVILAV